MIAATFQPTSQGCCGDTVISEIVHVVMRREPPTTFSLADPDFASLSPAAPASLLLAFVLLFLLLHQGASLTSAESLEHLTRDSYRHILLATGLGEGLPGPLLSIPSSTSAAPPRSDQFLSLPSPQAQ